MLVKQLLYYIPRGTKAEVQELDDCLHCVKEFVKIAADTVAFLNKIKLYLEKW